MTRKTAERFAAGTLVAILLTILFGPVGGLMFLATFAVGWIVSRYVIR